MTETIINLLAQYNINPSYDGKIHRFAPPGRKDKSGWYVAFQLGDLQTVVVGDWASGVDSYKIASNKKRMSKEQRASYDIEIARIAAEREREKWDWYQSQADDLKSIFNYEVDLNPSDFEYFVKKKIDGLYGSFFIQDKDKAPYLVIPMRDESGEKIWNFQRIFENGDKYFFRGRASGLYHPIKGSSEVFLCEGFATGVSIHKATGATVFVCFSANNLFPVAEIMKRKNIKVTIAADNDAFSNVNAGIEAAKKIKLNLGFDYVSPTFEDISSKPTDFNDLHILYGLDEVKAQLSAAPGTAYTKGFYYDGGNGHLIPDHEGMALDVKKKRIMCFSDSHNLIFNGKYWEWFETLDLDNYIVKINSGVIEPQDVPKFKTMIRSVCTIKDMDFLPIHDKINLQNGVLNFRTMELSLDHERHLFKNVLPISFDQHARCDRFLEFLDSIFHGDAELIELIHQMFGYTLIGGYPFLHKAFVLYGNGRNGKSTLLDVLKAVIGKGNFASVPMANLHKPFSAVLLDGKIANIVSESPVDGINAEVFKAAVAGEPIPAAHKRYDEFDLEVQARFIFACNDLPRFGDNSTGIKDRLVLIPFDKYIAEEDRDLNLRDKLMMELPGILNWSLDAALSMLEKPYLIQPQKTLDLKDEYQIESDPLYAWMDENLEMSSEFVEPVPTKKLYAVYCVDAEESGNKKMSIISFTRRMNQLLNEKARKMRINFTKAERGGKGVRAWVGVKYVGVGEAKARAKTSVSNYDRVTSYLND